jgi:tRNA-splicing ligase RtcB
MPNYEIIEAGQGHYVKAWMHGVYFEPEAILQLQAAARLGIVHPYVAAMPDCHKGYGSTVGSVIPTKDAVIPAAVGVDIGCGMLYHRLDIKREDLPENLAEVRAALEAAIPNGGPGDVGAWSENVPADVRRLWMTLFSTEYDAITRKHPGALSPFAMRQLGTLGTGNHFVELTTDSVSGQVGILLHSGSRGLGNKIGTYFTAIARHVCEAAHIGLPDRDLAYLVRGTEDFDDYIQALHFAQRYAWENRALMLRAASAVLMNFVPSGVLRYAVTQRPPDVHCHHNYLMEETHYGESLFITRKGAVRAAKGQLGIIPGSMGARTYIVEGLGSEDSFMSCSHGAGRMMSRTAAKKAFTLEDHVRATEGVECDKSAGTLDETPGAYKDIDAVMEAQSDLVKPLFTMKQFLCVKGKGEEKKWEKKKREAKASAEGPHE